MVDVVLLTLKDGRLHIGLAYRNQPQEPFPDTWCLPGGYIHPQSDQDAADTARRVLHDKAGITAPYLEQLITVSGPARDPRGWSASIVYYALVPAHIAPAGSDRFAWFDAQEVSRRTLPFDHATIIATALERVRSKTRYSALPLYLMPPVFTLTELLKVYEQVVDGKIERRSFIRRIEEMDVIEETGGFQQEGHRPAKQYRVKHNGDAPLAMLDGALRTG